MKKKIKRAKMKLYKCEYGECSMDDEKFIKAKNEEECLVKLFKHFLKELQQQYQRTELTFFSHEFKFCINEVDAE